MAWAPAPMRRDAEPPDMEVWTAEARAILSEGLEALRCFDAYAAYRFGNSTDTAPRSPADLPWDPPTSQSWTRATSAARELGGRAGGLLQAISGSVADSSTWRPRRAMAEAAEALVDFTDALAAYRARVDHLSPGGNGTGALDQLEAARQRWDAAAARWGVERAELIPCA